MAESPDQEIRTLRALYWSARDPQGRAFAPLAEAYRRRGELDEAVLLVRDGLGRLPDFATGHLVAARVARDRKDSAAARAHLDAVLDLDPENVVALVERADLRALHEDREGALSDLRFLLDLDPVNADARARFDALERESLEEISPAAAASAEPTFDAPPMIDLDGLEPMGADEPEPLDADIWDGEVWDTASESEGEEVGEVVEAMGVEEAREVEEAKEVEARPQDEREELEEFEVFSATDRSPEPEAGDPVEVIPDREPFETVQEAGEAPPGSPEPEPIEPIAEVGASPAFDPRPPDRGQPEHTLYTRTMGDLYARQGLHARAVDVYEHLVERSPDDPELSQRLDGLRRRAEDAAAGGSSGDAVGDGAPEPPGAGPTIAAYFEDLFAWVPGAVPIAALAPDATDAEVPEPRVTPEEGGSGSDGEDDPEDFDAWLQSLQP